MLLALTVPWSVLPGAHPVVDVGRDFSPAQLAREQAFHRAIRPPAYAGLLAGLLVAGLLGLSRAGAGLVRAAGRVAGGSWVAEVVLGTAALVAAGRLATLPFDAWAERALVRYGLSVQSWGSWLADWAKNLALTAVITALALLAVLALARSAPRVWWLLAAGAVALFVVLGSFAYPLVVEPLFNRFTPMPPGQLRSDLLALAARDHVPVRQVLVADASRRTTALNAYVSGFGSTRRIVVYDTLIATASPAEVRVVVAHELGHARRQDVLHGTLLGALAAAAGVCAVTLLLGSTTLRRRAGASGPADPGVIALVLFLVAAGGLLGQPLNNLVSRRIEARADVHSLQLTCDLPTFVSSQRRLAVANLSDLDPSPVVYALFFTHPSTPQRLALARAYAAAHCR